MFCFTPRAPIDRIPWRRPSGLKWRLEGGQRHSISRVWRPDPTPREKVGRASRYWVLSSEREGFVAVVGNYCFVGCLTRVHTDTSTCNSSIC